MSLDLPVLVLRIWSIGSKNKQNKQRDANNKQKTSSE
jgi:hypothetical protein